MFLGETYITNYLLIDDLTTDKGYWDNTEGSVTASFSSDGLNVVGDTRSNSYYALTATLTTDYTVECEITGTTFGYGNFTGGIYVEGVYIEQNGSNRLDGGGVDGSNPFSNFNAHFTIGDILKFVVNDRTVSVYLNETLIGSASVVSGYTGFGFKVYNGRGIQIKNLKMFEL